MIGTVESLDSVALPMCAVNCYGRIVAWNRSAQEYFGISAEDALNREWHSVIHSTCASECCALCGARRALRRGDTAGLFSVSLCVDDCIRQVTMLPIPLESRSDQILAFLVFPGLTAAVEAPEPVHPIPITSRIRRLTDGQIIEVLTAREREVLACVAEGFDAKTIAETMGITHATARNYVQRIISKLGAHNKAGAVNLALRYHLLAS